LPSRPGLAGRAPFGRIALLTAATLLAGAISLGIHAFTGSAAPAGIALAVAALLIAQGVAAVLRAERARLAEIEAALLELAEGRPWSPLSPARFGDLAPLALALASVAERHAGGSERRARFAEQLIALSDELAVAHSSLEKEMQTQDVAVEETASLQANINGSISAINREVEGLAGANEDSASSILELGSAVEQMAGSASALQETVESSTSSVHEMGVNIRQVANSADSVQQMAEETAASIAQMDHAIREVGVHVRGASELTELVSQSADEGSRAVGATIEGIARIRDLTRDSKTELEGLAERIGQIGNIATVIGGISDETNLLSLNAAIIAAQAGEHGKAFAVVADQVKTLARRTTSSTKEIERLISDVQARSEKTMGAMGTGIQAVEEGVARSRVAGETLEAIRVSARDASGRVAEIARSADEQARNSKYVADTARRTSEHMQQISSAIAEQSKAGDQLLQNATVSLEMCRQMSHATEEQRASGRYITGNTESITEMIRSIQQSTRSHERASAGVGETFVALIDSTRTTARRIPEIAAVIARLREAAQALRED
jgi:methyl-accepting chemotaxis protein